MGYSVQNAFILLRLDMEIKTPVVSFRKKFHRRFKESSQDISTLFSLLEIPGRSRNSESRPATRIPLENINATHVVTFV